MTEPTDTTAGEDVDEQLDTTDGDRDPLSTDDGLAAAAQGMPEVVDRPETPGEDGQDPEQRPLLDNPDLDVTDVGDDPTAQPDEG